MCWEGIWVPMEDMQKRYDQFLEEQRRENPESSLKSCVLDYEHPFSFTTKSYQENYLRRKFKEASLKSAEGLESQTQKQELMMNFQQATLAAKAGARLTRPSWEPNMYMWWDGSYFVHSHPYFPFQPKSPSLAGYFYVVEKDDAEANDWKIVAPDPKISTQSLSS